ncbi:MAG: leucine-rich repeat domain-containing protein [Treponema sp.]|jgi:hypothetical protein|nr:leucine-rich repeat domain-containing protein [Treponema sp.]
MMGKHFWPQLVFMAAVIGINVFAQNPASDFEYTLNDTADGLTITKYKGTAATVVIPGEIEGFPVTAIWGAFHFNQDVKKVTIPEGVTTVGDRAFSYCYDLVEVNLPQTLVTIGDYAFWSCEKLETIVIPEGVLNFGAGVFFDSGLTHILLPPNMTSIPPAMFWGTQLTQIIIPEGVTFIASAAFADCTKLTTIKLPSTLQIIGSVDYYMELGAAKSTPGAFENCKALTAILVPDTIKQIEFYIEPGIYRNESREGYTYQRDADHFAGCSSLSLREQAKLRNLGYKGRF